jgi:RimJ/RimL family protein N-acetyltransferase
MSFGNLKIESKRLLLVPISMKYKREAFQEFREPLTRFMRGRPAKRIQETESWISDCKKEMELGTDITLAIVHKKTGEFLGIAGLHDLGEDNPEFGVWIKRTAHGNKYGREAMQAFKAWTEQNHDYEYIRYPVAEQNIASRKTAESLGGEVAKEYERTMPSGRTYHMLEYWIPKSSPQ